MITIFEERRRVRTHGGIFNTLYRVRTMYLFGLIRIYRHWTPLTYSSEYATPNERN